MSASKSVASLSPTLLARKGAARPAMRPQVQPLDQFHEEAAAQEAHDDLGWDDMGDDEHQSAQILPIERASGRAKTSTSGRLVKHAPNEAAPANGTRRSAFAEGRRAAFTLRIDEERHLELKMAAMLQNRSAQQIVTEALDDFLSQMPEVSTLAKKVRKSR